MSTRAPSRAIVPPTSRSAIRTAPASTRKDCPTIRWPPRKTSSARTKTKARAELPQPLHDLLERVASRPDALERQRRQRLVDDVQEREEIVAIRLDVDQAGRELAAARGLVQPLHRVDLVGRIVRLLELLQNQLRPVVHRHFLRGARRVGADSEEAR